MTPPTDIHALAPARGRMKLRSVGVSGIRKPLNVQRAGRTHPLAVTFHVAVDLPSSRKGSDLSRNAEILAEIVDETVTRPVESLENACSAIAAELLRRHGYATEASVEASAEYFLRQGVSEEKRSFEDYTLVAEARATRGADGAVTVHRAVGAEAVGMTACPCAMETCRERLTAEFPLLADPRLAALPMISHNQRNRTRLVFELAGDTDVEAEEVIAAIEAAQSSPTYAILKRGDEGQVVLNAHRHPKFVEDVLRDLLASLPERFPHVPDSVAVVATTVSEESIHKYNVEASHRTTFGELRRPAAR
ncbi:MAG TPA: GTP cyclohydrolase MptA [Thermoplasmata archaeon]|nr:GTP cyclohydrolase MptA [Thermoplasmata archaeon]